MASASTAALSRLQVLVVDDEQLAREELCFQLGRIAELEDALAALRAQVDGGGNGSGERPA